MAESRTPQQRLNDLEELLEVAERKSDILTNLLKEANAEFEKALELVTKTESNFRAVFENIPEAIYIIDAETRRILDCNQFVYEWLGYSRQELLTMRLDDLVDGFPVGIETNIKWAIDHGMLRVVERKYKTKTGSVVDAEVTGTLVEYGGKECLAILVRDVTERKRLEAISRYKELFENVSDPVFINDFDGNFLEVNEGACRLFHYSREQLLSMHLKELVKRKQIGILIENGDRIRKGEAVQFELELTDQKGELIFFELHSRPVTFADKSAVLSVARDISVRKKLQETLIKTERLMAIGEMASGVAHNFNNLLQMVMGSAQVALNELAAGRITNCQKAIGVILHSAERGADIVRRIKDFTDHRSAGINQSEKFNLTEIVREAVEFTKPLWKGLPIFKKLKLNLDLIEKCFVKGRASEIYEVLVNLIKNSVEAMPNGGILTIRIKKEKSKVYLTVTDTGYGIPKENTQRIFDPFFTTKGWKSSGLGLSSSYGLIKKNKGEILVESDVGKGTMFTVVLHGARVDRERGRVRRKISTNRQGIRFLVIDDEVNLLTAMRMFFEDSDVEIIPAASGREGLNAFFKGNVDIILCDLGMDDMDGWEVAQRIKCFCESEKIQKPPFIIYTGWDQNFDQKDLARKGVDLIVTKPVPYDQLLQIMQKAVKRNRATNPKFFKNVSGN
ncbi:MAG: PAS domain S-box protein [Desulfomonilaceae bacterium]